ncbi:MAG: CoA transferase [Actinomycetota bacterium]|nr:CoA transferase [Actinomycetota bacterium]
MSEQQTPLEGVRVLDLSNLIAGPMLGMYLADFGAEVIKVEHPSRGDELRNWGHSKDGVGLMFKMLNRNKKTITLDLSAPDGRAPLDRLIEWSDVVIESFRPGTLERWGLDYESLARKKRELIMVRVSGYGQSGPYSNRAGFGTVAEAMSGYAYITGYPGDSPLLPSFGLADASTAIFGAFGVMLALYERAAGSGQGRMIDLALYEGLLTMLGPQIIDFDQLGLVQERLGSRLPFVAPRNTYRTADDKWIAIAGSTQSTFERIVHALEIDGLLDDPRFADNRSRIENAPELDEKIQDALLHWPREEALQRLASAGAAAGPVYDVRDILQDPHFCARGNVDVVEDEELGPVRMQNVTPRLGDTPGRIRWAGPPKGRHNREVFVDLIGLDEPELRELMDRGVV